MQNGMTAYDSRRAQQQPQPQQHQRSKDEIGRMMRALDNAAKQNGYSTPEIMQEYCGVCPPQMGAGPYSGAIQSTRYVPWAPSAGDCPTDVGRLLCWMYKGLCSFNKFGTVSSVALRSNQISLPDPDFDFNIGPEGDAVSLGVFFPRDWVSEAVFHGIYRLKVSFTVSVTQGNLTVEDVRRSLFDDLDFRILQVGTEDNFLVAINIGEAQDAERSTDSPALGGYYLPEGNEFVPFALAPEVFSFDFRGIGPGVVGTDAYNVTTSIRTYWKKVC